MKPYFGILDYFGHCEWRQRAYRCSRRLELYSSAVQGPRRFFSNQDPAADLDDEVQDADSESAWQGWTHGACLKAVWYCYDRFLWASHW